MATDHQIRINFPLKRKIMMCRLVISAFLLLFLHTPLSAQEDKISIYQGDSTTPYSLPSLIMAALHQADFITLPIVLTRDTVAVVYDDIFLHPNTNVADIFPGRSRQDGNYYLIDFTISEVEQLTYRNSDIPGTFSQHISTLNDAYTVISRLNTQFNLNTELLPEIKFPWFHKHEGKDISVKVLDILAANHSSPENQVLLQCFDPEELQRIDKELRAGLPFSLKLIQRVDGNDGRESMRRKRNTWVSYNYDWIFTRLGLRVLSSYAYGLSLKKSVIDDQEILKRTIEDSHGFNIKVYAEVQTSRIQESPQSDAAHLENLLLQMNADGAVMNDISVFTELFKKKNTQPAQMEDTSGKENGQSSTIFDDPKALSERLENIR